MPTKILHPLLFLIAKATHAKLARYIEYLKAENEILRAHLPTQIRTTPEERTRLVKLGKRLGTDLKNLITIVNYTTFLSWVRKEKNKNATINPIGRPRKPDEVRALVLRLAIENHWGSKRIHGELLKMGITDVCHTTVRNILKEKGLEPKPKRGLGSWDEFLKRHAETLWACDFVSKKIWTVRGYVDCFVLFVIHVASRRVHVVGVTVDPNRDWLAQQARNICMYFDDQPLKPTCLLHDRDGKFTPHLQAILESSGYQAKKLPIRSPNLNAYAERWVQSLRRECIDHFMVFGEDHLRHLCHEYEDWYNTVRPHQSLGNLPLGAKPPDPIQEPFRAAEVKCATRLGGLLRHYYVDAA